MPTAACIGRSRRKAAKPSRSSTLSAAPRSSDSSVEQNPAATVITTAITVSASRKAESSAATPQNATDSVVFERMPISSRVKTNSSRSLRK
ncbi:hypothetical protein D3C83_110530 [compost metagenome]